MSSHPYRIRIAAMTHQGLIRSHNEDCMGAADWIRAAPMRSPVVIECVLDEVRLCVLADGLGGHAGGEVASLLTVRELLGASAGITSQESLHALLNTINQRLYDIMAATPQLTGMGTTVVGLAAGTHTLYLFNVGDSRAYLSVGGYLRLLSRDDTAAANLPVQHQAVRNTHTITQSLGGLSTFSPIAPHIISRPVDVGARYLLCSDGLTDMLDLDAIEGCLTTSPETSVARLVQAALEAGGKDNVSVMIVDIC